MALNNKGYLRHIQTALSISLTAICCSLAYLFSFVLRFDFEIPVQHLNALWVGFPIIVLIRLTTLAMFHVHRGLYRYVSMHDFIELLKAVTLGSLVFAMTWTMALDPYYAMPRAIFLLEWMLSMASLVGLRVLARVWCSVHDRQMKLAAGVGMGRALIVGAGNLGETILRAVDRRFLGHDYDVVGFIDDDPLKLKRSIDGVEVVGATLDVAQLVKRLDIGTIIFAISDPRPGLFQEVVDHCDGLGVQFNVVSVLKDIATGEECVDRMRDLRIEDLLGRSPVTLDAGPVRSAMVGKTVMVTGAGGSIGSELCRQIAAMKPNRLILFESGETPLFEIDRELRQKYPSLDLCPFIGDIKYATVVERAFSEFKPDLVYHAAAYKHVPLMESHPDEAVLNNVRGTRFLAEAARRHHCKRFVMISSDKAVRPTNVMGATKRMCELVMHAMNSSRGLNADISSEFGSDQPTVFTAVRFGNVLGSNGSVIPIFKKQLETGGPLTITHPEMTRYFMTIPEAVSLVLQCGVIAEADDVFVLDMGTPVKIIDLARNMIRLSGLRENIDVSIKVTGLRPGEKMYEELVAYGEEIRPTTVPKVNVLKQKSNLLTGEVLLALIFRLEEIALKRHIEKARELLWHLIDLDYARAQLNQEVSTDTNVGLIAKKWIGTEPILPSADVTKSKGRVLAVLEDMSIQNALAGVVQSVGYELDSMDSIEESLRLLTSDQAYTAILCDCVSPSGTVWQMRDRMRNMGLRIPVFAMSLHSSTRWPKLLDVDADIPVLRKPFTPAEFESVLKIHKNPIPPVS